MPKRFQADRVTVTHAICLQAPPNKVFPLLCPVKEYDWIDGWKCEVVYTDSGFAEDNCIFKTNFPKDGSDVWVVSRYEPDRVIEFVRVNAVRAARFRISLAGKRDGTTTAVWTMISTALSPEGNEALAAVSEEAFRALVTERGTMLNHYFKTGKMLRLS